MSAPYDFTGEIRYSSSFEADVSADPYSALDYSDTGDPTDVGLEARIIAGHWHSGQSSALYAFHSSGHLDVSACIAELRNATEDEGLALVEFLRGIEPDDTSEEPCTDHGLDVCPDCGNAGTAIGPKGYYSCTRFLTCWTDTNLYDLECES